jgi:hypothetical protein
VSKALVKAAAVGCSVLLAAGFVSYRAGAFDSFLRPARAPVEPDPAPAVEGTPAGQPAPETLPDPPAMLSSSKSIILAPAPKSSPGGPAAPPAQPAPPIIGGSKSLAPLIPPAPPPASQSPNPAK